MLKPKGGRGYAAPYTTHQVRVPDPIKNQVHELIERYHSYLLQSEEALTPPNLLDINAQPDTNVINEEIEKLKAEKKQVEKELKAVNKFIKESKAVKSQAVALLEESLKLKANAGGAIKKEIEKALKLLT